MEEQSSNNKLMLGASIWIILSVLYSRIPIASLFFTMPLLLFAPRIKEKLYAVLTILISMVIILALTIYDFRGFLNYDNLGIILFSLFFQLMPSIGAMVWTALRDYSNSVLRKLVICSLPVAVFGICLAILLGSSIGSAWLEGIMVSLERTVNVELLGVNAEEFSKVFLYVVQLVLVPMGMVLSAVPIVASEFILHKRDDEWQRNFASMKMPDSYIWVFMLAWVLVLLSGIVLIPMWINVIAWNTALGMSLHYYMGGLSILAARMMKKNPEIMASRAIVPIIIFSIVPGVNIVVISLLTVLGALETWIKFR